MFFFQVKNMDSVSNNVIYKVPTNTVLNNRSNFEVLKSIMLSYDYSTLHRDFNVIYNNFNDDYYKYMCYIIITVCDKYAEVKSKNQHYTLNGVIQNIINKGLEKYRRNYCRFHLNYIGFIIIWKYYKINRNGCNTISKFNDILSNISLPSNLTTGLPSILKKFDAAFVDIKPEVMASNRGYYQKKTESEIDVLDKSFRDEFKKRFDEYKSYLTQIKETCSGNITNLNIINNVFVNYYDNCDFAIASHVLYDLRRKYHKLSQKYKQFDVDYKTKEITNMVFNDFSYYCRIGLQVEHDILGVCECIEKSYNKLALFNYTYPRYNFMSNDHQQLINSLIQ